MQDDIFKLFKNSLETVTVKEVTRGAMDYDTIKETVVTAIVKRRQSMANGANNDELQNNATTIHFMLKDKAVIKLGNYVKIDDDWRLIERVIEGKDFNTGEVNFIVATIGNEIIDSPDDPAWTSEVSA